MYDYLKEIPLSFREQYNNLVVNNNYLILSADSVRQLNVFNNYSFYTGRNKDL